MSQTQKMNRLLITGAAGRIGSDMRNRLTDLAHTLRLSDISDLGDAKESEEIVYCDLGDPAAVLELVKGCDGIVHLGGKANEGPWDVIRNANIDGVLNLYEAARQHGVKRIVFASSYHTIGYYKQTETLDASTPARPDSLYGVSKVFGEALASMYHDKFGIETALVRIGSTFPEPHSYRMMQTWFSPADFSRLIDWAFSVPELGCPIIFGVSDNKTVWWDNASIAALGWRAVDSSEPYRAQVEAKFEAPEKGSVDDVFQGGVFTNFKFFEA